MRKLWAVLGFLVATLATLAMVRPARAVEVTPATSAVVAPAPTAAFEQLKSWYASGQTMTLADIDGFYAGRCFPAIAPDRAEAILLGYYTRSVGEDRGPAFPSKHPETKLVSVQADHVPADYFDNDATFAENKSLLECNMKQAWSRTSSVHESPTLWYAIAWESAGQHGGKQTGKYDEGHSFVSHGDYIVERWTALVDQTYGAGWGYHKRGDILAMCYYFKKMN